MTTSSIKNKIKSLNIFAKAVISLVFWTGLWYLCALILNNELILPMPHLIIKSFFALLSKEAFYSSVALSVFRILCGYIAGTVAGAALAAFCVKSAAADVLFSPVLTIIRATPVASFIIITLVLFKTGFIPVITSMLMVVPIVYSQVRVGIEAIPVSLIETANIFKLKGSRKLKLLVLPAVKPYFISGSMTAIGLAWKAGIAAEVLCTPRSSIGRYLYESKLYLETDDMFAWTLTIILISLALEKLLKYVLRSSRKNLRGMKGGIE
ncbi:MAG: ABC transporter permease subunit [Oscillospiraceae bacterium]|nr:ABC transporter permease subunit [Oscillospiraceae bacterium]